MTNPLPTNLKEAGEFLLRIQAQEGREGYLSNALNWIDWQDGPANAKRLAAKLTRQAANGLRGEL